MKHVSDYVFQRHWILKRHPHQRKGVPRSATPATSVSLDNNFYILASLLLSLSTSCLCGSVDTSLSTNVILLQSPTFSDVCVVQNVIDTKRNSALYMSALEVLSQCAVFIYFLFTYLLFSVSRHSNAI